MKGTEAAFGGKKGVVQEAVVVMRAEETAVEMGEVGRKGGSGFDVEKNFTRSGGMDYGWGPGEQPWSWRQMLAALSPHAKDRVLGSIPCGVVRIR